MGSSSRRRDSPSDVICVEYSGLSRSQLSNTLPATPRVPPPHRHRQPFTTWLTPAAHAKLAEELEYLTTEGRRAIEKRIAEAREHGDLRENAEYDTAKNDQGLMEAKIRQIKHTLENSEVRAADNSGKVAIGTIVTVIDDDGDEMDYFIAAAENKVAGMILASPTSPVGSALLGALPCDQVSYQAPGGTFTMTVEAIGLYEG